MSRGVRKTPVEKLQGELAQVQASMLQYEKCLETMRLREKEIREKEGEYYVCRPGRI